MAAETPSGTRPRSTSRRSMLGKTAAGLIAGTGAVVIGGAAGGSQADAATAVTPDWLNVVSYGADPTGAKDSAAAIRAAVKALPSTGGVIYLPRGTYKVASTVTCTKVPAYFLGDGDWATRVEFTGSGDCFRIYDPTPYDSRARYGGGFRGITVNGTNAKAGSSGLHVGDVFQYDLDVTVESFSGPGSIGVHLDNTYFWTEQLHGRIYAQYCASHVVFDVSGTRATSSGSFERCDLDIFIDQEDAYFDGVVFRNGAFTGNGSLRIRGNFASYTSAPPVNSAVLRLTGSTPAGRQLPSNSGIVSGLVDIGVECPSGTYTPQTIIFGSASNTLAGCYGALNFGIGSYENFSPSNNDGNVSGFQGPIIGDNTLPGPWLSTSTGLPSGWTGHVAYRLMPSGNEVMLTWALTIASGTAVKSGVAVASVPSGFHYYDNKILPGNISGGGLDGNLYAPTYVTATGSFEYNGPSFTASGTAWWYGQGIYTLTTG